MSGERVDEKEGALGLPRAGGGGVEGGKLEKGGGGGGSGGSDGDGSTFVRVGAFVANVVQAAALFVMMQYSQSREDAEPYNSSAAVLVQEFLKVVMSFVVLSWNVGSISSAWERVYDAYANHTTNTFLLLVPGILYVVQNNLLYVASGSIGGPETQTVMQLKMLTTAVFAYFLLGRRFSLAQWGGLVLLAIGCALVQMEAIKGEEEDGGVLADDNASSTTTTTTSPSSSSSLSAFWGVMAVCAAATTSGAAGIATERLLKDRSVGMWEKNVQLASWSVLLALILMVMRPGGATVLLNGFGEGGILSGFDGVVWVTVLLGSLGGLLVALILRYLNAIYKNYAAAVSILLSAITSSFLQYKAPSALLMAGIGLVTVSIILYRYAPPLPDNTPKPPTTPLPSPHDEENPPQHPTHDAGEEEDEKQYRHRAGKGRV